MSEDDRADAAGADGADADAAGAEARPGSETGAGAARRGPTWVILGVVAAALVVCCCSAVLGLGLSWSAGLFDGR
ncbi:MULTISPECIES: hypothetical protein [Micromonospora]|uniref:Uncharacterized protein n=1 Tax=Micromonospora solifontis TaxID=2487138 RepID=A0ABX9WCZ8_9ACTN|nr:MULTISPECIES: hypothetical protein [Micromonospora]NES15794.1 hypothetical protein [Micromonospora sp. PPF5-17B]NES38061.1 hypothetical protein [Micromonospora solifontis]NES56640.1 hypothetical protein [Micromonospora sp. PPF5-6]RNL97067.1 hypothetical protein EFE23_18165 [Micromonospora solifontis]